MEKSLWIEKGGPFTLYECPFCHETFDEPWNYCPDCGKKMIFNEGEKEVLKVDNVDKIDLDALKKLLDGSGSFSYIPACCINCPNHPTNGGSGICNCSAPYITSTAISGGINYQKLDFPTLL